MVGLKFSENFSDVRIFVDRAKPRGLSPTNLNSTQKNPQNSGKNFQTSENSTDFSNCIPIKNSEEKSAEILPASSTKNLKGKYSDFPEKIVVIKFSEFLRTLNLFDRTKPWVLISDTR
jgi:hypothetical protein